MDLRHPKCLGLCLLVLPPFARHIVAARKVKDMNRYSKLLENSLNEIETYSSSIKGKEWSQDWYRRIMELIRKAALENNQGRAEELIDMVSWYIVDSGPFDLNFCPSISVAQEAVLIARRQREPGKHE